MGVLLASKGSFWERGDEVELLLYLFKGFKNDAGYGTVVGALGGAGNETFRMRAANSRRRRRVYEREYMVGVGGGGGGGDGVEVE